MTKITGEYSSVSVVPRTKEKFNLLQCRHSSQPQCQTVCGLAQYIVQYVLGLPQAECEANYTQPSSAEVMNSCSFHLFMALRLTKYSDNFTIMPQDTVPLVTPCTIHNSQRHRSTDCHHTVHDYKNFQRHFPELICLLCVLFQVTCGDSLGATSWM